jgi:hypothetical protein
MGITMSSVEPLSAMPRCNFAEMRPGCLRMIANCFFEAGQEVVDVLRRDEKGAHQHG